MYHIRDQMILYLCWRENAMLWKKQAQCYSKIQRSEGLFIFVGLCFWWGGCRGK